MSASDNGTGCPATKKPEAGRDWMTPSAARRSYASTTVEVETSMVLAIARIEGSLSPVVSVLAQCAGERRT